MRPEPTTTLGIAYLRRGGRPFGIRLSDRLFHQYVIGQTGTGKSTLLERMAASDLRASVGLVLIDPHGDISERVRPFLCPQDRYWNVADPDSPYGYNPLTRTSAAFRPLVASGLIDALKKQWADAWGVRMEHLLRYAVLALLEQPRADLRDVMRLFLDKSFRASVVASITDEQVRRFWTSEYPALNIKTASDGVAPIANKLGAFLAHPAVRSAITEPKEPIRFRALMDEGGALIVNLAKGRVGADVANVLGGLLVASIGNAALTRHDLPEAERRPFFLYVDEFHSFTTLAFATMLSEVRKYGLGVILAEQYLAQAEAPVTEAILGNVGSVLCFRVGAFDAPLLSAALAPVAARDLMSLANYELFARIMVAGERTQPFSACTLPPIGPPTILAA